MKLRQIIEPGFGKAYRKLAATDVPLIVAYRLKAITAQLDVEQTKFEDTRKVLVEKYSDKDENGLPKKDDKGNFEVGKENIEEYYKEINTLLDTEVEVKSVKMSSLGTECKLSLTDLMALDKLIEE